MKPVIVIGLGNILMGDEGIGVVLVRELDRQAPANPDIELMELGTGGMAVVHALAGRRAAVIIDCARMGEAPGAMRRFTPEAVRSSAAPPHYSLHEGNLLELIALARRAGECPKRIEIFGIEPATLAPGETLSPALQSRLGDYMAEIQKALKDLN